MKKFLLIMTLIMSQVFSVQKCHEESGWCFDVSVYQSFYLFHYSEMSLNYTLQPGDSLIADNDVIGVNYRMRISISNNITQYHEHLH